MPTSNPLAALVKAKGGKFCNRCKCCEMLRQECEHCGGEGMDGHDCGEDSCCCLYPEENVRCQFCNGKGWWWYCDCDEKGVHHCKTCQGEGHTSLACPKRERKTKGGTDGR